MIVSTSFKNFFFRLNENFIYFPQNFSRHSADSWQSSLSSQWSHISDTSFVGRGLEPSIENPQEYDRLDYTKAKRRESLIKKLSKIWHGFGWEKFEEWVKKVKGVGWDFSLFEVHFFHGISTLNSDDETWNDDRMKNEK